MAKFHVGDRFPDLAFRTATGKEQVVHDVLQGKTVFWILRYIGCTVCNYDIHLLQERYHEFTSQGAQVFVVLQSDAAHVGDEIKGIGLPFDIICDEKQVFYKTLGIEPAKTIEELLGAEKDQLDEKVHMAEKRGISHGDYEGDELQLPALFVVEEDRRISHAHYATELMDMPVIDDVLKILENS